MAEIKDPFEKFHEWYDEAKRSSQTLPYAMCLSTVGADGCPSARMVLLSSFDRRGFLFPRLQGTNPKILTQKQRGRGSL